MTKRHWDDQEEFGLIFPEIMIYVLSVSEYFQNWPYIFKLQKITEKIDMKTKLQSIFLLQVQM